MKKDLDNIINDDRAAEIAQQMVDQFGTTPVMRINAEANYENMSGLLLSLQLHYSTIEKSMQYKAEKLEMLKNKDGKKARKLISALEQLNQQRITFGGAFYEILQKMHELGFYDKLLKDDDFQHLIHGGEQIDLSAFEEETYRENQRKFAGVIGELTRQAKAWTNNPTVPGDDGDIIQAGE